MSSIAATARDNSHPAEGEYDADFAAPADFTLESLDGILFNIDAAHLERTSGFFRAMFALPTRGPNGKENRIEMFEHSDTLRVLLKLAVGLRLDWEELESTEEIETILAAAEKLEMEGAAAVLMMSLQLRVWTLEDPLVQYGFACRYSWEDMRQTMLERCACKPLDLEGPIPPMDSADLARLIAYRQARIDAFADRLTTTMNISKRGSHAIFYMVNKGVSCCQDAIPETIQLTWRDFQSRACKVFSRTPSVAAVVDDQQIQRILDKLAKYPGRCGHAPAWTNIEPKLRGLLE